MLKYVLLLILFVQSPLHAQPTEFNGETIDLQQWEQQLNTQIAGLAQQTLSLETLEQATLERQSIEVELEQLRLDLQALRIRLNLSKTNSVSSVSN